MAKVHGISGSTRYLLKGTKTINGKKLATLEDIDHFHHNYEAILTETQITVQQQQDEMILNLGNNEVRLDSQLRESIAIRTVEVDGNINEIKTKIENTENVIIFLGYKVQHWIARSLRSHRIHSPFSHISRELHNVQSRKASLITNKPYVIKNECNNVISNQKFITENISFLIGAKGEEHVISVLSQLPDEYHVLNDVNLISNKYIYWKKRNEHIKTCQIDHLVIGPTGIILLETKNWKTTDIGKI
ncbi:MAG: nuclease-related domain-containing protein [Methanoregula sp.]|nr:nuclease-related domain-containing protein [Methanoregula sp.]